MNLRPWRIPTLLLALGLAPSVSARQAPPPEIQRLLDKLKRQEPLSADEQRELQLWTLRKANGTDQKGAPQPTPDQNAFMPPDVQRIIAKSQSGQVPTADELARLKSWAAEMKGKKQQLIQDAATTRSLLEATQGGAAARAAHATPVGGLGIGTVTFHVVQTAVGPRGSMREEGTATMPVHFMIDDETSRPEGGLFRVRWFPDTQRTYHLHFTGESQGDHNGCNHDHVDHSSSEVQAEGAPTDPRFQYNGQMVAPAGRRTYIEGQPLITAKGPLHVSCPCGGGTVSAAPPLSFLVLDNLRGDVPFNQGFGDLPVAAMGARMMDRAPAELRGILDGATFDLDMKQVQEGLRQGVPFSVKGTYRYTMKQDGGLLTSTTDFTFHFGPGLEMVIQPADGKAYEQWIPSPVEGSSDIQLPKGTRLTFHVALISHGGDEAGVKEPMELALEEPSRHPGLCGNYPHDPAAPKANLRFSKPDPDQGINANLVLDNDEGTLAHLKDPDDRVDVTVEALDTGGFAKLTARCKALGLVAKDTRTKQTFTRIPMDDDGNHIADAWEKAFCHGKPATWDQEDRPFPEAMSGDGLSLYEEYRGFVSLEDGKPVFRRLKPGTKKLFVFPMPAPYHDAFVAGVGLFQASTGLQVFLVPGEDGLKDDGTIRRDGESFANWMNFNNVDDDECFLQHQYAVRIREEPPLPGEGDPGEGKTFAIASTLPSSGDDSHDPLGPWQTTRVAERPGTARASILSDLLLLQMIPGRFPNTTAYVQGQGLDPAQVAQRARQISGDAGALEALVREVVTWSVAHELGHALNASHHDPDHPEVGDPLCFMRYWSDPNFKIPFQLGAWNPAQSAWVPERTWDKAQHAWAPAQGTPALGHGAPWAFCAVCRPKFKLHK